MIAPPPTPGSFRARRSANPEILEIPGSGPFRTIPEYGRSQHHILSALLFFLLFARQICVASAVNGDLRRPIPCQPGVSLDPGLAGGQERSPPAWFPSEGAEFPGDDPLSSSLCRACRDAVSCS